MSVPVEFVNDRGNKVEIKDTEARRLAGVAQTAAENAQSTANGANTLAQSAKDIADAASSAASTNTENINILNGKVTALEGSVSDIEEDIETIKEDYISKEELQPYDVLEDTDNLPLTFTTNGESLIDYKIYGNDNSNHIDEVTNNLPITIPNAKAGTVEDWTIEGNNIPQVESTTEVLPLTFPSNGDNVTDYTIYGNDNPCEPDQTSVLPITFETVENKLRDWEIRGNDLPGTENLFDITAKSTTSSNDYYVEIIIADATSSIRNDIISYFNQHIGDTFSFAFDIITEYSGNMTKNIVLYFTDNTVTAFSSNFTITKTIWRVGVRARYDSPSGNGLNYTFNYIMLVKGSTAPDHYIPYQQGVGERTVNLFDVGKLTDKVESEETRLHVENGVIYVSTSATSATTADGSNHTLRDVCGAIDAGVPYTLKATSTGTTKQIYLYGANIVWAFGETKTFSSANIESIRNSVILYYASGINTSAEITNIILVQGSTAPSTYVPYGYEIPISVNGTPQTFYIGSSPLTAGQSISKTSTGVDITTQVGENTISTTLYNKPVMYCGKALGVGIPTENLFDVSKFEGGNTHVSASGLSLDISNQTVIANLTSNGTYPQVYLQSADDKYLQLEELETYTISLYKENVPEGSSIYLNLRAKYNGGNEQVFDSINDTKTITIPSGWTEWRQLLVLQGNELTYENCKIRLDIVKGSTAPSTYIPHGYKVPITITDENSNTVERTIYTGNSRLLEGQSITKTQAGIDIPTTSGNNIISTTLYNKPQMNVVCNSNVLGVGQKTNDGYILPITVTDSSSNSTNYTFQLGSQPLAQGQSISKTSTGTDIALLSGTNTISTSLNNKPNMFISYQSGELGVGVRTENLFNKNATDTSNGYEDNVKAQWSHSNSLEYVYENDNNYFISEYMSVVAGQDYYPTDIYITSAFGNYFSVFFYDSDKQLILTAYNNTAGKTVAPDNAAYMRVCIAKNKVDSAMMTTKSTDTYIPFGYKIPLVINDTNKDIYIGNSLLTSGNSISKTSAGIDINTIKGENTISTTLDNKPTMYIKYSTDSFSRIFTTSLPTTFINHSDKVKDWVIYGNENGVGIETDNIFNGTYQNASITVNNNTYTYDTSSTGKVAIIPCEASTQYTVKKFTTSDKLLICEYTAEPQNNDTLTLIEDVNVDNKTFTTSATAQYIIILVSTTNAEPDMTLVTGSTAPTSYIPYGYKIPLTVNGIEIPIYIGTSTLGANDTVSKTSTNIDIPTIDGENTITTTLTNKPTMKITKDFVTKEYIEDVANSCMNDNVEDIVENVVDDKVDKQMFFMFYSSINKNGMFRGKNLTNVYTVDEIYQMVHSGTFDDLYLGDYFTKSITTDIYTKFTGSEFVEGTTYYNRTGTLNNWVYTETEDTSYDGSKTYYTKTTKTENVSLMIAHFNYYYNIGDTALTNPHIILTNRNYGFATTSKMNPTNTTVGGYYNSEMHQTTLPCYAKSLKTALNNHLLSHKTLLSNAINASTPSMAGAGLTGASSAWAWYDTELQLMTEQQLFGSGIWTSSAYDVGCDGEKLAVFNFVNGVQNGRDYFWLRSVASSTCFALCYSGGSANYTYASNARYVRPLIVFG